METKSVYLPHELITQILLRLPVKSLIRFKCVCKSWFSLISDPHFANSHFQITAATHTRRALFISTSTRLTRSIDVDASFDHDFASLNLHFLLPESYSNLQIKGSCRGFILLCCSFTLSLYLWNPSTGFHKKIPLPPFASDFADGIDYFYGFWYDPLTDDYLVVSMSIDPSHLEIFSLRANTWKEEIHFTDFSCGGVYELEPKAGLFFNGAIHWFAFHLGLRLDVIISFDLIERKLFYIHLPDEFKHDPNSCGLWVFGEFLSFWAMDYDNDTVEIWVMKEYKVHSSWTKTHVLPVDDIPSQYFSPLCSTKSGDIIGTDYHNRLVKYNDEGQLLVVRSYYDNLRQSQVALYTESLLSLPGDNEQQA